MAAEVLDVTSMIPAKFEPKRKNRFVLMIEGIDAYLVKTAARPAVTTEEVEIPFMNSRRYLAKQTTFGEMAVTLHDPIAPSGAQQVMEWIRTHYESVSGRSGYADFYKRDIQLKVLDPVGTVVELWDIKGAFLKSVTFGDLTYADQEIAEISLSIRFDNCVLQFLHSTTQSIVEKEGLSGGLLPFVVKSIVISYNHVMHKCSRCEVQYEKLSSLSKHFRRTHNESPAQLYVELFCEGKKPTCACGCGSSVRFNGIVLGFVKFKRGHAARINNNWGHNETAQLKSQAVRREMFKRGEITCWSRGKSSKTDEKVANAARKMRETILADNEERQRRSNHMKSQWEVGSLVPLTGSAHSRWRGGTSPLAAHARSRVFPVWAYPKMKEAGFKCSKCGAGGKIDVHHDKERFADIMAKGIETLGEPGDDYGKKTCFVDWVAWYHENNDVSGVVLCRSCHLEEHKGESRFSID